MVVTTPPVIADVLTEERLTFSFPTGASASKYDGWTFYRKIFNSAFGGTKAMDLLYVASSGIGWLIEVKDYRYDRRTKVIDLADEVALKLRDTLAGLMAARMHATETDEKQMAKALLARKELRVVLHLEVPAKHSRYWTQAVEPSKVQQKLKSLVKAIDPHPAVVSQHALKPDMDWSVTG